MKNKLYLLIILLYIVQNCNFDNYKNNHQNYQQVKYDNFNTEKINFNQISKLNEFNKIQDFKIINDKYLLILTNEDNKLINILDIKTGKVVRSYGKKGHGPGEYISIWSAHTTNDHIWITAPTNKRLYKYNLNKILKDNKIKPENTISLEENNIVEFCIKDSMMIFLSNISRIGIQNLNTNNVINNKYIPGDTLYNKITEKMNTLEFLFIYYRGYLDINQKTGKMVVANRLGDIIEIYDSVGKIEKTLHGPDLIKPEDCYVSNFIVQDGYYDVCSNDKYIFGLYSGIKNRHMKEIYTSLPDKIIQYDWSGKPIKLFKSKNKLEKICISNNDIYAIEVSERGECYLSHAHIH